MPRATLRGATEQLLSTSSANITGTTIHVGRNGPPYTIMITGSVTSTGVVIESTAVDSGVAVSADFNAEFGPAQNGGTVLDPTLFSGVSVGIFVIDHPIVAIRARTNGTFTTASSVLVTLVYDVHR